MEERNVQDLTMMKKLVQVKKIPKQYIIVLVSNFSGWRMDQMEICWILQQKWKATKKQNLYKPNTIEWRKNMSRI